MPRKKYTIQDIATELNTSCSTVSRALQDNPRISQDMRRAVKELALKHNYHPDFRATSLRKGSGKTIGVVVPQFNRHFFSSVLSGIDEVATTAGYSVLVCQSSELYEKEVQLINNLMNGRVDGLIVSISLETKKYKHFDQIIAKGIPMVFFDRVPTMLNANKVVLDDYVGGVKAMEHLINQGCRKIIHFSGPQHINVYHNRTRAYLDTLAKHNIPIKSRLIFENVITQETGYNAMEKILRMPSLPDAIYSSGDYSALGAILCARHNKISMPNQLVITGFANEPWSPFIEPSLTSVDQHALEIGKQAAILLLNQLENINDKFVPRTVTLDPTLITRNSSQKNPIILPDELFVG